MAVISEIQYNGFNVPEAYVALENLTNRKRNGVWNINIHYAVFGNDSKAILIESGVIHFQVEDLADATIDRVWSEIKLKYPGIDA